MESPLFSPKVRKIIGEIVEKPRRSFSTPTQICLQDWWLSKPENGDGICVGGVPMESRKCDDGQSMSNSSSAQRRLALREFNPRRIAKRHSSTILETCDGFTVLLCSCYINKLRTQHNGFSSEICRDFNSGFPPNWEDYAAHNANEESKKTNLGCIPADLKKFSAPQINDLMSSLTDAESDILSDRAYDNLMQILSAQEEDGVDVPSPPMNHSSPVPAFAREEIITRSGKKRKAGNHIV